MMPVKCRYAGSNGQVCKSELREGEHSNASVLGIKDRFPQRHKRNLTVPLRAALNTTYGRCLKQGSDTKHVPSKDKTQKKLPSYQLFINSDKMPERLLWLACPSPGEDTEGTLARGTGDVVHEAPILGTFALRATLVSEDFGKKNDHCGNLSLKFNILLSVRMQSFWEIQSWQLKIKQPCGNSETNSSAPVHPSQHAWSPQSPVILSPDQVQSPQESCSGSYLEMHPSRTISPTACTCSWCGVTVTWDFPMAAPGYFKFEAGIRHVTVHVVHVGKLFH